MSTYILPAELVIAKDAEFIVDAGDTVVLYDDGMGTSTLGDGTSHTFNADYAVTFGATLLLDVASLSNVYGLHKVIDVIGGGTIRIGTGGRPYTVRSGSLYRYRIVV